MLSIQFKLLRQLYTLIIYALIPFIFCRLWLKGIKQPEYRRRWKERLGYIQPPAQPCILIHCVSVGETLAAEPLIKAVQSALPNYQLHVTTITVTGSNTVQQMLPNTSHSYLPYDAPHAIHRFLNRLRPKLIIMLETEIWPNLLFTCHQKGIPVLLSNARLSTRSMQRYQMLGTVGTELCSLLTYIAAQSAADEINFKQLGVPQYKIAVTGSLKFDKPIPTQLIENAKQRRKDWQLNKTPLVMAGSTRNGEEVIILNAFAQLKKIHAKACLLLAPRHPQRFDAVKRLCQSSGLHFVESQHLSPNASLHTKPDIILINEMGKLFFYYAMADICFVGGSLVDQGCQNVLEPAMLGKPIITGPSTYNFKQICEWLKNAGGLITVNDTQSLVNTWSELINDSTKARQIGAHALKVYCSHQGASQKQLKIIQSLLKQ